MAKRGQKNMALQHTSGNSLLVFLTKEKRVQKKINERVSAIFFSSQKNKLLKETSAW